MNNYRLEYNQKQGNFHIAETKDAKSPVGSWKVLADSIQAETARVFIDKIVRKYSKQFLTKQDLPSYTLLFNLFHTTKLKNRRPSIIRVNQPQ